MSEFEVIRRMFENVYENDIWDGGSGPGSSPESTTLYRAFVEAFVHENNVKTVTDLGCGDWQFSRYVNWSNVNYVGLDVVPALVERNNARFASEKIEFRLSTSPNTLPGGDLILCKEVLQHLSNHLIFEYLAAIQDTYKFALITNSVGPSGGMNKDIAPGDFRPLRVDLPPFNAKGAHVLTYYPCKKADEWVMKNSVFLMLGNTQ
jgi:SAM-dependent methyltransferase